MKVRFEVIVGMLSRRTGSLRRTCPVQPGCQVSIWKWSSMMPKMLAGWGLNRWLAGGRWDTWQVAVLMFTSVMPRNLLWSWEVAHWCHFAICGQVLYSFATVLGVNFRMGSIDTYSLCTTTIQNDSSISMYRPSCWGWKCEPREWSILCADATKRPENSIKFHNSTYWSWKPQVDFDAGHLDGLQ